MAGAASADNSVAIVSYFEMDPTAAGQIDDVETVRTIVSQVTDGAGIDRKRIGFTCSGSCDFLVGRPFSWLMAMDGVGAWPPIEESHVEMDGAWALYEAWVRLQHGDIDAALVYTIGQAAAASVDQVLGTQLDPYYLAPLGITASEVAGLQAQALLNAGAAESDFWGAAANARLGGTRDSYLTSPRVVGPLRQADVPRYADGAAAVVLARGDFARQVCARPAWIKGIAHATDPHGLGVRDLTRSPSLRRAAEVAGVRGAAGRVETNAPFGPQELIVARELREAGLDGSLLNEAGGTRHAHPVMVSGLVALGRAAGFIQQGGAARTVAHATSGPALQHNLVAVLEATP